MPVAGTAVLQAASGIAPGAKALRPMRSPQLIAFALLISACGCPLADDGGPSEYEAKAAVLYNLTKFVDWPASAFFDASAPLVICVLGEDPFGPGLDAIGGRLAQGRRVAVSRVAGAAALKHCHMVFMTAGEQRRLAALLTVLRQRPVLLVGDGPGFADHGAAINLFVDGQRIGLEINPEAAQRRGLRISSRVLRLARIVSGDQ